MSLLCEICGLQYEWEMFFNNHMRNVHSIKKKCKERILLNKKAKDFLDGYYTNICEEPSLDEIKELAKFLDVKKECVYWWFFNRRRKRDMGNSQTLLKPMTKDPSLSRYGDVKEEGSKHGISDRDASREKSKIRRRTKRQVKENALQKVQALEKDLAEAKLLAKDVLDQCDALQKRHMLKTQAKVNVRQVLRRQLDAEEDCNVVLPITSKRRGRVVCDCGDCDDYVEESYDTPDRIINPGFVEQDHDQVD